MIELLDPFTYIPKYFKITTKADANGISQLVPLNFYPAQDHYVKNRTHRDIVVKARQIRFSTGALALNSHTVFTTPFTKMSLITHLGDASTFLLQTVHTFYKYLPDEMKPRIDWSSSERIRLPELDCLIHIASASSRTIGRSESLNIAHLSEVAFWYEPKARELWAGISQTVPKGGFILLESTPNGRGGLFYDLYHAAKRGDMPDYHVFFYPWWFEPDYKLPVAALLKLTEDEALLQKYHSLTDEQIQWRRYKIAEIGDLFYQEYPENDVDCWLSTASSPFDAVAIRHYLLQCSPGRKEGNLEVWSDVQGGKNYVIGVDVGGGLPQGDFSVATVLETRSCRHCATLRGRIPPDLFAEELMRLGKRYNNALIAVERIQHGGTVIKCLLDKNYPNIYFYRDFDRRLRPQEIPQPGWVTSGKTRPVMIDTFNSFIRSKTLESSSKNLFQEASSFINVGMKAQAAPGQYDDELLSILISLLVRETTPVLGATRHSVESYVTL